MADVAGFDAPRGHADPVAQAEIDRLRAGEDRTPREEMARPSAAQLWHRLLESPENERLLLIMMLQSDAARGWDCYAADHAETLRLADQALAEIPALRRKAEAFDRLSRAVGYDPDTVAKIEPEKFDA